MSPSRGQRTIDEIARVAQWVGQVRPGRDWEAVELDIGTVLPSDYKELLSRFPSGAYREFVWVTSPIDVRTDYANFIQEEIFGTIQVLGDEELEYLKGTDYRLYPKPGGLLPWGNDGQGGIFCWIVDGRDPDQWRVAYYNQDANEWGEHQGPVTEVIWEVLTSVGDDNILGFSIDDEPAVFRVPSTHMGNGVWLPNPEYR
ncbi:SMI1/KNR4 family protein [Amycolatopsis circi]|uniref:SMI1/KNR4 family protein n=1 Tax=Amycolatopsis circi TaxID=871959 RepID=UPI000E2517EF|nr:SMI1/KNR4 family protein [Amycolatopsis circi]